MTGAATPSALTRSSGFISETWLAALPECAGHRECVHAAEIVGGWSEPISAQTKSLAIPDVGLAKVCRRGEIPLPPRGYGAKLNAGRPQSTRRCHCARQVVLIGALWDRTVISHSGSTATMKATCKISRHSSRTMWAERSRASAENLFDLVTAPFSQELESPPNPGAVQFI